jgi:hypothetical protein
MYVHVHVYCMHWDNFDVYSHCTYVYTWVKICIRHKKNSNSYTYFVSLGQKGQSDLPSKE